MSIIISELAKFAWQNFAKAGKEAAAQYDLTNDPKEKAKTLSKLNIKSYADLAKKTQLEIPVALDSALTMYDSTGEILKFLNTLYGGMVISSAGLLTDAGKINTLKFLEQLNPARSPMYNVANGILSGSFSGESLHIPEDHGRQNKLPTTFDLGLESSSDKLTNVAIREANNLTTVANLGVGQLFGITLSDGSNTKDVTISVRFIPIPVTKPTLSTILNWGGKDLSVRGRLSAYRAGELTGWRDLILFRDVFVERTRLRMEDKSGMLETLLSRNSKNIMSSILTATPSLGTISAIMVISDDNLHEIERKSEFRFDRYSDRQRIMNATGLMFIAVVDPMTETFTLYTYGNGIPAEYSVKQIKGSKGGNDITEIVKLITQNNAPSSF